MYLLGMYLGDGYIAAHAREVYALRFSLDLRYPAIIEECAAAIREIAPANRVGFVSRHTWIELYCWSKGWPRLFPQHGPGKKHERAIVLVPWQQGCRRRSGRDQFGTAHPLHALLASTTTRQAAIV